MKKPIFAMLSIILGMVIVVGLGLGVYWYIGKSHAPHKAVALTPAQALALQVSLPQMLANLGDGSVIQFTLSLQASDAGTKTEITDLQNQIENYLIRTLKGYSAAQLDRKQGFSELRQTIVHGVNAMLPSGKVTAAYFSNEIVQSGG